MEPGRRTGGEGVRRSILCRAFTLVRNGDEVTPRNEIARVEICVRLCVSDWNDHARPRYSVQVRPSRHPRVHELRQYRVNALIISNVLDIFSSARK